MLGLEICKSSFLQQSLVVCLLLELVMHLLKILPGLLCCGHICLQSSVLDCFERCEYFTCICVVKRHNKFRQRSRALSHLLQQSETRTNVVVLFAMDFLAYLLVIDCKDSGSSQFLFVLERLQHTYTVVEKSSAVLSYSRNAAIEKAKQVSD